MSEEPEKKPFIRRGSTGAPLVSTEDLCEIFKTAYDGMKAAGQSVFPVKLARAIHNQNPVYALSTYTTLIGHWARSQFRFTGRDPGEVTFENSSRSVKREREEAENGRNEPERKIIKRVKKERARLRKDPTDGVRVVPLAPSAAPQPVVLGDPLSSPLTPPPLLRSPLVPSPCPPKRRAPVNTKSQPFSRPRPIVRQPLATIFPSNVTDQPIDKLIDNKVQAGPLHQSRGDGLALLACIALEQSRTTATADTGRPHPVKKGFVRSPSCPPSDVLSLKDYSPLSPKNDKGISNPGYTQEQLVRIIKIYEPILNQVDTPTLAQLIARDDCLRAHEEQNRVKNQVCPSKRDFVDKTVIQVMESLNDDFTFPKGCPPKAKGGEGIFFDADTEDGISIWIDMDLGERQTYIRDIVAEGGRMTAEHWSSSSHILILSPQSVPIFDMYCHPEWLKPRPRYIYYKRRERDIAKGEVEAEFWTRKVILKHNWIEKCLSAGKFLGAADHWGGCRVGGPPVNGELVTSTRDKVGAPTKIRPLTPPLDLPNEPIPAGLILPDNQASSINLQTTSSPSLPHSPPVEEHVEEQPVPSQVELQPVSEDVNMESDQAPSPQIADTPSEDRPLVEQLDIDLHASEVQQGILEDMDRSSDVDMEEPVQPEVLEPPSSHERSLPESECDEEETIEPLQENVNERSAAGDNLSDPVELASPIKPAQDDLQSVSNIPDSVRGAEVQEESVDPSKLFEGLQFWVDPAKSSRNDFLKRLTSAGGSIVTSYPSATHCLISGFLGLAPTAKKHWAEVTEALSRDGIWFVDVTWAIQCLDDGKRVSEVEYAIPGGFPPGLVLDYQTGQRAADGQPKDVKPNVTEPGHAPSLMSIFEKEKVLSADSVPTAAAKVLKAKYGTYAEETWLNLMSDFRYHKVGDGDSNSQSLDEAAAPHGETPAGGTKQVTQDLNEKQPSAAPKTHPVESADQPVKNTEEFAQISSETGPLVALNAPDPYAGLSLEELCEKAYDNLLGFVKKRKRIPKAIKIASGLSSDDFLKEYEKYHDRIVTQNITGDGITEALIEMKAKAKKKSWRSQVATTELVRTVGVLDLDGWREKWNLLERKEWLRNSKTPTSDRPEIPLPPADPTGISETPISEDSAIKASTSQGDKKSGSSSKRQGYMSSVDVAHIFSNLVSRIDSEPRGVTGAYIAQKYPAYTPKVWSAYIKQWDRGVKRFAGRGPRWNPSKTAAQIDTPDTQMPAASAMVSASASDSQVKSTASPPSGEKRSTKARHIGPGRFALIDNDTMAQIFETHLPLIKRGMPIVELGQILHQEHGHYSSKTWAVLFGQWRRQEARFGPKKTDEAKHAPGSSRLSNKRPSDSTITSALKRERRSYGEDEERQMAKHIARIMPEPTRTVAKDWEDLAQMSTRSAAALAEHYRGYRDRIDGMVREMLGPKRQRATTVNSDDSSVVALSPPSSEKDAECVDMTGLDSD